MSGRRSAPTPLLGLGAAGLYLPQGEDCLPRRSGAKARGEGFKFGVILRKASDFASLESNQETFAAGGVSDRLPIGRMNNVVAQTEPAAQLRRRAIDWSRPTHSPHCSLDFGECRVLP